MKKEYAVLSSIGNDRTGMADDISRIIASHNCNIEDSKMAVLGGEFAVILLLSGEEKQIAELERTRKVLGETLGLELKFKRTEAPTRNEDGLPYLLESVSMDTPGIVHALTAFLKEQSINVEELETEKKGAPLTGTPLFHMRARITLPPSVPLSPFKERLCEIEEEKNLDIRLKPLLRES